jgi:hypothetical protein
MKKFAFVLFCLSLGPLLHAAEGFSSLEEQMTGKEFSAAGLDKLNPSELAALNSWIRKHSLATLDAPKAEASAAAGAAVDQRGFKSEEERSTITSRIVGTFKGWDGQTTFKLENGMIWTQADKGKFYTKEVENPVVVIEPGMFGSWHLHVEGQEDSECKVERIQ